MPSVNERKALKYGKKLNQAQRLDKSIISDARKEWKQLGLRSAKLPAIHETRRRIW